MIRNRLVKTLLMIRETYDNFQSMTINMYFAVSWLEPRLVINETAVEWDEDRTGPKNVKM